MTHWAHRHGLYRWMAAFVLLLFIVTPTLGSRSTPGRPRAEVVEFSPLFASRLQASLADLDREDRQYFFRGLTDGPPVVAASDGPSPLSADLSVCWLSGCVTSVCTQSGCLGSVCIASGCFGSICVASACKETTCGGSFCVDSECLGSACVKSSCPAGCDEEDDGCQRSGPDCPGDKPQIDDPGTSKG